MYAKTREECEALLPGLIEQMKAEIKAIKESRNLDAIPDGISEKKKAIAAYMREHPEVTSKSAIAKAVGTRQEHGNINNIICRRLNVKWYCGTSKVFYSLTGFSWACFSVLLIQNDCVLHPLWLFLLRLLLYQLQLL